MAKSAAVQKKPAAKAQTKPEETAAMPWVPLNCSGLFADAGEMRWSCSRDFVSLDGGVDSFYTDYNWRFNKELETGLESGRIPVYKLTYTIDPIDMAEPALLRGWELQESMSLLEYKLLSERSGNWKCKALCYRMHNK